MSLPWWAVPGGWVLALSGAALPHKINCRPRPASAAVLARSGKPCFRIDGIATLRCFPPRITRPEPYPPPEAAGTPVPFGVELPALSFRAALALGLPRENPVLLDFLPERGAGDSQDLGGSGDVPIRKRAAQSVEGSPEDTSPSSSISSSRTPLSLFGWRKANSPLRKGRAISPRLSGMKG